MYNSRSEFIVSCCYTVNVLSLVDPVLIMVSVCDYKEKKETITLMSMYINKNNEISCKPCF